MMNTMMTFPKTIDEFIDLYTFVDRKEVYTNGSELIQVFRVQQALDHYLPKWISVKERLPDIGQIVLTYCNDRGAEYKVLRRAFSDLYKAAGLGDGWYWESIDYMTEYPDEFGNGEVTHWMPLPDPPEVADE